MLMPALVSTEEVRRLCQLMGLSDWTRLEVDDIPLDEAEIIRQALGPIARRVDPEDFRCGLVKELLHGRKGAFNLTNNHPLLTGLRALNHLLEEADYYQDERIRAVQTSLSLAIQAGDGARIGQLYHELVNLYRPAGDRRGAAFE